MGRQTSRLERRPVLQEAKRDFRVLERQWGPVWAQVQAPRLRARRERLRELRV
jgi:hypothetical protein